MIEYYSAGESHGPLLTAIINGFPAGVPIDIDYINARLADRMKGYGRGDRMKIERDTCEIVGGVRNGETIGAPIAIQIHNRDYVNWKEINPEPIVRPRPGHADLVGAMKYRRHDMRDVLERSSARETAIRVAVGAFCRLLLQHFNIDVFSHVTKLGGITIEPLTIPPNKIDQAVAQSELNCTDPEAEKKMKVFLDECKAEGNTVGGVFQVIAIGVPPCLGSYASKEQRLDARLGGALLSINAIKGVEIGMGFEFANHKGSDVMDEIFHDGARFYRKTNHAGGIEGGISNGEAIILNAVMKPIPTLKAPLQSVNVNTKEPYTAVYERSDVCALPAASLVGKAMVTIELASALTDRYGGETLAHMKSNMEHDQFNFEWLSGK
jgi:chorismate synthase